MLVIRLLRVGKKNQPSFKIVVVEKSRSSVSGRFVEQVGFYNPLTKEKNLKADRIKYWLSVGAKPSDTVHNLIVSEKIIEGKKVALHKKSKKQAASPATESVIGKEQPAVEQPAAVEQDSQEIKETETAEQKPEERIEQPAEQLTQEAKTEPIDESEQKPAPAKEKQGKAAETEKQKQKPEQPAQAKEEEKMQEPSPEQKSKDQKPTEEKSTQEKPVEKTEKK